MQKRNVLAHCLVQTRNGQTDAHPKRYRVRSDLALFLLVKTADRLGFKRHPTLWALTRVVLFHLRMHWTSVDGLGCRRPWQHRFQAHAAFWAVPRFIGDNFRMHRTIIGFDRGISSCVISMSRVGTMILIITVIVSDIRPGISSALVLCRSWPGILRRIRIEILGATWRAKIECFSFILARRGRGTRLNFHTANWISALRHILSPVH